MRLGKNSYNKTVRNIMELCSFPIKSASFIITHLLIWTVLYSKNCSNLTNETFLRFTGKKLFGTHYKNCCSKEILNTSGLSYARETYKQANKTNNWLLQGRNCPSLTEYFTIFRTETIIKFQSYKKGYRKEGKQPHIVNTSVGFHYIIH